MAAQRAGFADVAAQRAGFADVAAQSAAQRAGFADVAAQRALTRSSSSSSSVLCACAHKQIAPSSSKEGARTMKSIAASR